MTGQVGGRLAEIRERLGKITPRPWLAGDEHDEIESDTINRAWCVSATNADGDWSHDIAYISTDYADEVGEQERVDAEFIAAAPVDIADLTDALLAVLALADKWQGWGDRDPDSPVAAVFAGELRRAVAAHLDPKKEN